MEERRAPAGIVCSLVTPFRADQEPDLPALGEFVDVYAGNNEIVVPAFTIGARGAVSAIASAVPELMVAVYERWAEGKQDEALDLQRTVARLHRCIEGIPYLGAIKHLAKRRGLPGGGMRAPQPGVTSEQAAEVDRRLDAVEELRPWLEPLA